MLQSNRNTAEVRRPMNWRKARLELMISTGSEILFKASGFLIIALLARYLIKEDFGQLMFALAFTGILVLLTNLGTTDYLIREAAARPGNALKETAQVASVRILILIVYLGIIALSSIALRPDLLWVVLMVAIYTGLKDLSQTFGAPFLGLKRPLVSISVFAVGLFILTLTIVLVVVLDAGFRFALLAYCLAGCVWAGLGYLMVRTKLGAVTFIWDWKHVKTCLGASLPLFILIIVDLLHFKLDALMVGIIKSYGEVARYEAAAKLLEASQFLIRPFTLIFFPICSELAISAAWGELRRLLMRLDAAALLLGGGLALFVMVLAGTIIPIVYGSDFGSSVAVLQLLFVAVPALFITTVGKFIAISLHLERSAIVILLSGLVLNIALNCAMIPSLGAMGAAWATVISQTLIALGITIKCWRELTKRTTSQVRAESSALGQPT